MGLALGDFMGLYLSLHVRTGVADEAEADLLWIHQNQQCTCDVSRAG